MATAGRVAQAASPATLTFPTFLDTDPYPSTRDGRPTSSGSIATTGTTGTSEFGEDFGSPRKDGGGIVPSVTGPVGEPGLPPSRPTTGATATSNSVAGKRSSLQPPDSRRGLSSRPGTAASKTHVPTLAASAFFRPMSSSKLQAQRNQVSGTSEEQAGSEELQSQEGKPRHRHRYSDASINTLKDLRRMRKEKDEEAPPLPVSRGTQVTTDGENTAASVNSATPLQGPRDKPRNLDLSAVKGSNGQQSERTPRSPRSLRASLGLGSRTSKQDVERRPSPNLHEKLNSDPSSPAQAEKSTPTQPSKAAGKNYEYFAGNMLFCLSGRCMNTKARPLNVATFILTILPGALFFAFSAPWLWHHISPALPIVFAYVFYVTISSFLHAAVSDPGILPRNLHPHPPNPDEDRDPLTPGPTLTEWVMVKTFPSSHKAPLPDRRNDASGENGAGGPTTAMEVPTKYCKSCNIWRPPRAHHCRVCDSCVETQDHHCVWLNNCVGRRNYRFFFGYVAFGSLLALMLLAFSIIHIYYYGKRHHLSFAGSLTGRTQERVAFAMFIYAILALPYPGSLFIYHLFLIARGETTREYLNSHKFMKKDRHRPFTQASVFKNWMSVLLRPRPPTYMQFKRPHRPGDVRLGYAVPKKERKRNLKNRYSVQGPNGMGKAGGTNGTAADVEMKQLPQGSSAKPQARSAGGLAGPVNSTPRD